MYNLDKGHKIKVQQRKSSLLAIDLNHFNTLVLLSCFDPFEVATFPRATHGNLPVVHAPEGGIELCLGGVGN